MKAGFAWAVAMAALLIAGCGGGGNNLSGEVSGLVFDETGVAIPDARVFFDGSRQTRTNVAGMYTLTNIPARDVLIRAEAVRNNVRYVGENVIRVEAGERAKSVNIPIYRQDQIARIYGEVRDRQGFRLRGVRVFLRPANGTQLSSATAITNADGVFEMGGLRANLTYEVQVNALGYNSDFDAISLNIGERRRVDFVVPDGNIVNVPAPTNVQAVAYTAPARLTRDVQYQKALESVKDRIRPQRKSNRPSTRVTALGNPIQVDLYWDRIDSTGLLGFGIYRGNNAQNLQNVGFLRDPQAEYYADLDDRLVENRAYVYGVTSLDTLFDGTEGESGVTNTPTIIPLGDLVLNNPTPSTFPTFRWQFVNGASNYSVFLYDEAPGIGVAERFTNYDNPTSGNTFTYNGPALGRGRTYWYIVVAERADGTAVSFSPIDSFVVP